MCGLPLDANGSCLVHKTEHDTSAFPGATVCTHNLKARIVCRHDTGLSLALDIPADLWANEDTQDIARLKKRVNGNDPILTSIRSRPKAGPVLQSLMSITSMMCDKNKELSMQTARERREHCNNLMTQLDHDALRRGYDERTMIRNDLACAKLMRSQSVRLDQSKVRSDTDISIKKLKSSSKDSPALSQRDRDLVCSHGHLFPKSWQY